MHFGIIHYAQYRVFCRNYNINILPPLAQNVGKQLRHFQLEQSIMLLYILTHLHLNMTCCSASLISGDSHIQQRWLKHICWGKSGSRSGIIYILYGWLFLLFCLSDAVSDPVVRQPHRSSGGFLEVPHVPQLWCLGLYPALFPVYLLR